MTVLIVLCSHCKGYQRVGVGRPSTGLDLLRNSANIERGTLIKLQTVSYTPVSQIALRAASAAAVFMKQNFIENMKVCTAAEMAASTRETSIKPKYSNANTDLRHGHSLGLCFNSESVPESC